MALKGEAGGVDDLAGHRLQSNGLGMRWAVLRGESPLETERRLQRGRYTAGDRYARWEDEPGAILWKKALFPTGRDHHVEVARIDGPLPRLVVQVIQNRGGRVSQVEQRAIHDARLVQSPGAVECQAAEQGELPAAALDRPSATADLDQAGQQVRDRPLSRQLEFDALLRSLNRDQD